MRVLVAMSGGVDSSVAAALVRDSGHDTVGVTLKLWGGSQDSGCCSVADVDDARRVAQQLGIDHHVFNLTDVFERTVVAPYVDGHARGLTPNPCIECNRHVKFDALVARARRLGFDALATGHHARIVGTSDGPRLARGVDAAKDQSYVLSMLDQSQVGRLVLPVGEMSKAEVRRRAARLGLRTAGKADSQDVCFIHSDGGRARFLGARLELHPATLVDATTGAAVGSVPAVELVTLGQRRGLGLGVDGRRRFAVDVDVAARRVTVDDGDRVMSDRLSLDRWCWVVAPLHPGTPVVAQVSAHGRPVPATLVAGGLVFDEPQRLVAPGQTVAFYDPVLPELVTGSAVVAPG